MRGRIVSTDQPDYRLGTGYSIRESFVLRWSGVVKLVYLLCGLDGLEEDGGELTNYNMQALLHSRSM